VRKLSIEELNRLSPEEFQNQNKIKLVVVLDNIRSANNVGSVFRTADAYLVEEIHLCGITACPPNKEIQKTALGATDTVSWKKFASTKESVQGLIDDGYKIFSIEQAEGSTMLQDMKIGSDEKIAIVLGNEVNGVDQDIIDMSNACLELPQYGTKHSLNVSVCSGIVIWELFKQLKG